MATQYTSTRIPVGFIRNDGSGIHNGSLALAETIHTIVENQHYLAMGDPDVVNFMAGGPVINATRIVTLIVPPFCQYASFHFHVAQDFNEDSSTLNYIDISCAASSRRTTSIPFGEDIASTGKTMTVDKAGWVHFEGISDNPASDRPSALMLFSDANVPEVWTTVDVTVTIPDKVYVYTGAYITMPPRRLITVKS
jgi:hypothetical protein